jgi:NADH:ubiquinone oxidoreductase subunit
MFNIGTWLLTKFTGVKVGVDEFGNKYYRTKKVKNHVGMYNKERRWVIYNGKPEPTKVPAYWHGWLHYSFDDLPTDAAQQKTYAWQKSHLPNLTGTKFAYLPKGHIAKDGKRDKSTGDYQAWQPK